MITIPKNTLIRIEEVESQMALAKSYFSHVKDSFTEETAKKLCENVMKMDNVNVAIALGSLFENKSIKEFIATSVVAEVEEKKAGEEGKFTKGTPLAKRREIARKAARTRRADPAKAKSSEEKRQDSRKENSDE